MVSAHADRGARHSHGGVEDLFVRMTVRESDSVGFKISIRVADSILHLDTANLPEFSRSGGFAVVSSMAFCSSFF